ncbi:MAG TPA: hypothetical protein DCR55_14180, partial [Lentisphaeria bacterium]|nr:hypothetical protein [Lentisphaeria bacterium]
STGRTHACEQAGLSSLTDHSTTFAAGSNFTNLLEVKEFPSARPKQHNGPSVSRSLESLERLW